MGKVVAKWKDHPTIVNEVLLINTENVAGTLRSRYDFVQMACYGRTTESFDTMPKSGNSLDRNHARYNRSHRKCLPQRSSLAFIKTRKTTSGFLPHAQEIEGQYKGKFIAVVNRQLFVGKSWEEVQTNAKAAFPDRDLIVKYIPWKRQVQVL